MHTDLGQALALAVIQGLTEFLPISSSGHLLLPTLLLGWRDQGLPFDVAVHVGTLAAVVAYFRRELLRLGGAWLGQWLPRRRQTQAAAEIRLAWQLLIATLPAGAAGWLFHDGVAGYARSPWVVGTTSIVFGLLLWHADRIGAKVRRLDGLNQGHAWAIGLAQALALLPGVSRSGITMTAGLLCGLDRAAAARFSFLLAIPVIAASGAFLAQEAAQAPLTAAGSEPDWLSLALAAGVAGLVAAACLHGFLGLIDRIGYAPFVVYRVAMGAVLLLWAAGMP